MTFYLTGSKIAKLSLLMPKTVITNAGYGSEEVPFRKKKKKAKNGTFFAFFFTIIKTY
jgi:hypothetical protein